MAVARKEGPADPLGLHVKDRDTTPVELEPEAVRDLRTVTSADGVTRGRKLNLPDGVFDRLQLLAIQRRMTVSAVATQILDSNLPRLRIERD